MCKILQKQHHLLKEYHIHYYPICMLRSNHFYTFKDQFDVQVYLHKLMVIFKEETSQLAQYGLSDQILKLDLSLVSSLLPSRSCEHLQYHVTTAWICIQHHFKAEFIFLKQNRKLRSSYKLVWLFQSLWKQAPCVICCWVIQHSSVCLVASPPSHCSVKKVEILKNELALLCCYWELFPFMLRGYVFVWVQQQDGWDFCFSKHFLADCKGTLGNTTYMGKVKTSLF